MTVTDRQDYVLDISQAAFDPDDAVARLNSLGFVVLRNAFPAEVIENVNARAEKILQRPSIGGSIGYYMKDSAKKLYDPLLLGGPTVDLVTDERVIDIAERYLEGECILSEVFLKHDLGIDDVYFPLHRDFEAGGVMNEDMTITQEIMNNPFAVGAMIYLHDTREGAFCYSAGSHKLAVDQGKNPANYPEEERNRFMEKIVRVEGLAGDLVMFDERGFHGPEQPVKISRRVIIFDHFKVSVFARATKWPLPVLLHDLGHLNQRQLRFLGLGASSLRPYEMFHIHHYDRNPGYPIVARAYEGLFALDRLKRRLRSRLKGHRPSYLRPGM